MLTQLTIKLLIKTQTTEILVGKVLKSWGGLNLKCHVPHELSIIRNLSSPPSVSNASLVRSGRHSFFYGLPNSKNLATSHITQFPVIGEEFPSGFELSRRSDLPSITASSGSSLLNDHVRRRRCFPLVPKAHSSKRNNSSPSHGAVAFEQRRGEITALQPLICSAGTLHHAACATPEAAGAALAGAFQNSLY